MCVSLSILDCWTLLYKNTKTIWKQNKNSQIVSQNSEKINFISNKKMKKLLFQIQISKKLN
jgi:hypothetical protein